MNRGELSKAFAEGKTLQEEKTTYMFTYSPFTKQNQFQPFIHAVGIALSGTFQSHNPARKAAAAAGARSFAPLMK